MKFDRLKLAGLVVLSLMLLVVLGACGSAGPVADGNAAVGYDVTVLVVDEGDNALEGAGVRLDEMEKATVENGAAVFAGIGEGSYELDVELEGYAASDGDTGSINVGDDLNDFTVVMVKGSGDAGGDENEDGAGDGDEASDGLDDGEGGDDPDDGNESGESEDGDGGEDGGAGDGDETSDGVDDGEGDDGGEDGGADGSRDGGDGDDSDSQFVEGNEDGVMIETFNSGDEKVIGPGILADGESAIVAISPLNLDPDNSNTYDVRLNVNFSDGSTASQTTVKSLSSGDLAGDESSEQAELDAEMRELEDQLLDQDLKPAGEEMADVSAQRYSYNIGDKRIFYNYKDNEIGATLEAIGDKLLIYVDDEIKNEITAESLSQIADAYDNNIYPGVMRHFGFHNEADYDWDGNGKTTILIYDMNFAAGYFHSKDYFADSQITNKSNEADMFYINHEMINWAENSSYLYNMDNVLATIAHEFQHLVFFVNKRNAGRSGTDTWINEGFSMLAEYLTGYRDYSSDYRITDHYFPMPEQTSVMAWEQKPSDYGASGLITYYLYEKLGRGVISDIQTSRRSASQVISDRYMDFSDLMLSWMLSNYIDRENIDDYSYSRFNLDARPALSATIDGSFSRDFSIKSTAVKYFEIVGNGSNVILEIEGLAEDTGVVIYLDGEGSN